MHLTPVQVERFLNEPLYSWDVRTILSGIVDFLDFSERNLAWQREREVRRAMQEANDLELEPEDEHLLPQTRSQIIEAAEWRFDIGLSQSVRRAGLVEYVSSIEWCAKLFAGRLVVAMPPKPSGVNEAVYTLQYLSAKVGNTFAPRIKTFQQLVTLRNCVVHAVGLLKHYRYETELRLAVSSLGGFSISTEGFMGEAVHIASGAVDSVAKEALEWIPQLDEQCSKNGLFKAYT
jgi:hypothetical protein